MEKIFLNTQEKSESSIPCRNILSQSREKCNNGMSSSHYAAIIRKKDLKILLLIIGEMW